MQIKKYTTVLIGGSVLNNYMYNHLERNALISKLQLITYEKNAKSV